MDIEPARPLSLLCLPRQEKKRKARGMKYEYLALTGTELCNAKVGDLVDAGEYQIAIELVGDPKVKLDINKSGLTQDQLRTSQVEVSLPFCDANGIGASMRFAILKEVESVRKRGCFILWAFINGDMVLYVLGESQ